MAQLQMSISNESHNKEKQKQKRMCKALIASQTQWAFWNILLSLNKYSRT